MNDYYDFFWYQLCLNIQALRSSAHGVQTGAIRTYNLKPEHFDRINYDNKNVYIQLIDVISESQVHISKYDFYSRVDVTVNTYIDDKQELKVKLIELADTVLGEFILLYIDRIK